MFPAPTPSTGDDDDLFGVRGKVVLITGGGTGIGKMMAEEFVKRGASVYIASRKVDACVATAAEFNRDYGSAPGAGSCHALGADVSTDAGCCRLAAALAAVEGQLHVLVNNSGASWGAPLLEYAEAGWSKVMAVNVAAPFQLTRACLPLLDAASALDDPARVINIGSVSGLQHQPFPTYAYDASKAAVHALTKKLAAELARRPGGGRITVNAIAPGFVPTAMSAQLGTYASPADVQRSIPLGRWGKAADVAGAALFLAGRQSGAWVTGVVLPVDGGVLAQPLQAGDDGVAPATHPDAAAAAAAAGEAPGGQFHAPPRSRL